MSDCLFKTAGPDDRRRCLGCGRSYDLEHLLFHCPAVRHERDILRYKFGQWDQEIIRTAPDALPDFISLVHDQISRWEQKHKNMTFDEQ